MRLTPLEIRQHRFARRLRGLDPYEVYAFLETVVADFEAVARENAELRREQERLLHELGTYQGREQTIQQTLTTAQGVVEQLKRTALKEAEVLVSEAEVRAERTLKEAETRRSLLQSEIADLRLMRERAQLDLRRILEGYLKLVTPLDEEPDARPPLGRPSDRAVRARAEE